MPVYILKHTPEDFVVEECIAPPRPDTSGKHLLVRVTKREWNTESLAAEFARLLGIRRQEVGYAGTKDKVAVATQHFTLAGVTQAQVESLTIPRVELAVLGTVAEPLGLGLLTGNRFSITVRNLADERLALPPCVPNYYDEQRFSSHNAEIGEALLRKEFISALRLIEESGSPHTHAMRGFYHETNDAVGALLRLPRNHLKLYLHAFQSLLWNRMLAAYIARHAAVSIGVPYSHGELLFPQERVAEIRLPLPGFAIEGLAPEAEELLHEALNSAGLAPRDFVLRQFPNLSLTGDMRAAFMNVQEFTLSELEPDEEFPGKRQVTASFSLPPGSYATMLIRALCRAPR